MSKTKKMSVVLSAMVLFGLGACAANSKQVVVSTNQASEVVMKNIKSNSSGMMGGYGGGLAINDSPRNRQMPIDLSRSSCKKDCQRILIRWSLVEKHKQINTGSAMTVEGVPVPVRTGEDLTYLGSVTYGIAPVGLGQKVKAMRFPEFNHAGTGITADFAPMIDKTGKIKIFMHFKYSVLRKLLSVKATDGSVLQSPIIETPVQFSGTLTFADGQWTDVYISDRYSVALMAHVEK